MVTSRWSPLQVRSGCYGHQQVVPPASTKWLLWSPAGGPPCKYEVVAMVTAVTHQQVVPPALESGWYGHQQVVPPTLGSDCYNHQAVVPPPALGSGCYGHQRVVLAMVVAKVTLPAGISFSRELAAEFTQIRMIEIL